MASEPRVLLFVGLLALSVAGSFFAIRYLERRGVLGRVARWRVDLRMASLGIGMALGLWTRSIIAFLAITAIFAAAGQILFAVQSRKLAQGADE